jgi:uncharacterized membrane-anchored protein
VLGGIGVYGASIMLIAQMYHLDGNPPDAVLLWALGALLAAGLVRSNPALAAAFVLLTLWTGWERGLSQTAHGVFLLPWAATAAVAAWRRWRPGLHLAALSLVAWLVPLGYLILDRHGHWLVAAIGIAAALTAVAAAPAIDRWIRASQALFAYAVAVAFAGLFLMQFVDDLIDPRTSQITLGQFVRLASLTLALLVAAMFWALRTDNRGALWIAYVAFAVEIFAIYVRMLGTLQHLAVLPYCGADRQRPGVGGLSPAPAPDGRRRNWRHWGRSMSSPRNTLLALAAVALAQTAVLADMVIDRVRLVTTGREVVLPVVPVDPRDLFKGDYVRLSFEISRLPTSLLDGAPPPRPEAPFYVTLEKKEDGTWAAARITRTYPHDAGPGRVALKGRLQFGNWSDAYVWPRYGIESYFVPQGQGLQLEAMAREKKLAVRVAVDRAGDAAIKGLIIDGKLQYEEPSL